MAGALLDVELFKKCTRLRREIARSRFQSENGESTKRIQMFRPLLEVAMSKKCMLLWRGARFKVKM